MQYPEYSKVSEVFGNKARFLITPDIVSEAFSDIKIQGRVVA